MGTRPFVPSALTWLSVLFSVAVCVAQEPKENKENAVATAIRAQTVKTVAAFNAGKAEDFAASFLPTGEYVDEDGTVYEGQQEIKELATAFFKKFPGAKLAVNIESIRVIGGVAIDEGVRTITVQDGSTKSQFRYIAVRAKTGDAWPLVSFRDFLDNAPPTPHEMLQPVAWLVGDWINEGVDGKVAVSYRWSEDKNYLLGEFQIDRPDIKASHKSTQRIGWDPVAQKIRSWLFDADGGFSEAVWTALEDEVVIKASTVNPDGTTATATMTLTRKDKDHFSIKGTDRIVGDVRDPDFEINIARRPPAPMK